MGRNNRGQVTIFIIAGIALIAIILLLLLLRSGSKPGTGGSPETNAETFLQTCLQDSVSEAVNVIEKQGGYANPQFYLDFKFTNEPAPVKIAYLCYTDNYNEHCVDQEPMLFQHVKEEIKNYISQDVENCFSGQSGLTSSLSKEGYVVEVRHKIGDFNLDISRNQISVKINGELVLTKSGETKKEKDFNVKVSSGLYDILMFPVQEILRKKTSSLSCYFDSAGYGLLYDEFNIQPTTLGNGTEIYTIEYKKTKEMFRFAVRSCIERSGYGA
ncbi:hypothetical protein HY212_01905 [Candidatus Pacearchaeota archaeon]|nr:hypothetical protein [Candidatus Pacearchaeota archaeon]